MGLYLEIRERCPSCKTTEAKTLFEAAYADPIMRGCMEARGLLLDGALMQGLEGAHYTLEECARCGLIYQREIPTELLMGRLYGSREGAQPGMPTSLRGANSRTSSSMRGRSWGRSSTLARRRGRWTCSISGWAGGNGAAWRAGSAAAPAGPTSPSRGSRTRGSPQSRCSRGMRFRERQFDLINIEQVLEHVPAPLEILLHLERGLKPAGLIRIGVPNGRGIKRRLKAWDWTAKSGSGRSLKPVVPLRHINCFTHDALVRLAAGAGFVPVVIPQRLALSIGEAVACRMTPRLKALFHRGTTLFFKRARENRGFMPKSQGMFDRPSPLSAPRDGGGRTRRG